MSYFSLRRRLLLGVSVVAMSAALGATSASASSVGCTGANGPIGKNYSCLTINGSGTFVNSFRVTYNKAGEYICASQAKVTVTSPAGTRWTYWSSYRNGCVPNTAWFDFSIYRSYPSGSKACGTFYTNGAAVGGSPCNYIRS